MFGVKRSLQLRKTGFTLIELLIAMAIIAILAAVIVPNLTLVRPEYQRKAFFQQLNGLMNLATAGAIADGVSYQLFFDIKNKIISVRKDSGRKDAKNQAIFELVQVPYGNATFEIPDGYVFKNFYIEGADELRRQGATTEVWFFVTPSGLTQTVVINILDILDVSRSEQGEIIGLVLNPFTAQFTRYDTIQKP